MTCSYSAYSAYVHTLHFVDVYKNIAKDAVLCFMPVGNDTVYVWHVCCGAPTLNQCPYEGPRYMTLFWYILRVSTYCQSIRSEVSFQTSMHRAFFKQLYRLCERRFVRIFDLQKGFSFSEAVNDGSGKEMVWVLKI